MQIRNWMSWEGGFDLVAVTSASATMPNLIVHVARMVHTPVGSCPAGMVLIQPDAAAPPKLIGFVATDAKVGAYFGPAIFAGTPFEQAPVLAADIHIQRTGNAASARVAIGSNVIEATLTGLAAEVAIDRAPMAPMVPFQQRVIEAIASGATIKFNGQAIPLIVPPTGISGGPAAVWATTGFYGR